MDHMSDDDKRRLQQMAAQGQQQAMLQGIMLQSASSCFDICTSKSTGAKLGRRENTCVENCVQRFWDARAFLAQQGGR